ncbi:outer membrane protein [Bartonella sp. B39]
MNIRSLITTSFVALISASAAQAADVEIPHEIAPVVSAPAFSWTGFYLGGQIGNFLSKIELNEVGATNTKISKDMTPKLSGFMGGIYAGSNIDLGNDLIFGVETDAVWADKGETKTNRLVEIKIIDEVDAIKKELEEAKITVAEGSTLYVGKEYARSTTYKEKWSGATRVRLGFTVVDRFMPYVAGGITYAQVQGIYSIKVQKKADGIVVASGNLSDETKTLVGYTLGGGVDFTIADNVILRAEYRYSDFGKKKYSKDKYELDYKTNDFRVGVAYKF